MKGGIKMEQRLIECLRLALINNASDIHFTLAKNKMKIELRINKKIYPIKPKENDDKFFRYLMYRANIDLSNKSIPQTGNFEITFNDKVYSLRLALLNTKDLSCGVLRILNNHHLLQIKDLCDDDNIIDSFYQIANINNGLILFSGPTCSGKTTTLYTILHAIKGKKIYTLEDPIEVYDDSIVQLQINEANNFSYANGIKQLMRHDPDIIMIGEIRDEVAANMAIRCALTGHLVLTSIHSASCSLAIERLLELQVKKLQLKDVLCRVYNQRQIYDDKRIYCQYSYMDRRDIELYLDGI